MFFFPSVVGQEENILKKTGVTRADVSKKYSFRECIAGQSRQLLSFLPSWERIESTAVVTSRERDTKGDQDSILLFPRHLQTVLCSSCVCSTDEQSLCSGNTSAKIFPPTGITETRREGNPKTSTCSRFRSCSSLSSPLPSKTDRKRADSRAEYESKRCLLSFFVAVIGSDCVLL